MTESSMQVEVVDPLYEPGRQMLHLDITASLAWLTWGKEAQKKTVKGGIWRDR